MHHFHCDYDYQIIQFRNVSSGFWYHRSRYSYRNSLHEHCSYLCFVWRVRQVNFLNSNSPLTCGVYRRWFSSSTRRASFCCFLDLLVCYVMIQKQTCNHPLVQIRRLPRFPRLFTFILTLIMKLFSNSSVSATDVEILSFNSTYIETRGCRLLTHRKNKSLTHSY